MSEFYSTATHSIYRGIVSPLLDRLDSETWHDNAKHILGMAGRNPVAKKLLEKLAYKDKILNTKIAGIQLENPVIVAAGWDKTGEAVEGLVSLGFATVEVGTVPEFIQVGNPKPREFIIANGVAINRMGFNSPGMEVIAQNLERLKNSNIPIGISVGKNKNVTDEEAPVAHARVVDRLYDYGSYFVINVSSPNTPGLRNLQDKKPLTKIIKAVQKTMEEHGGLKPLFVKIAPDMTYEAVDDVIDVVKKTGITGIIAINTMVDANVKGKYPVRDKRLTWWDHGRRRTWADEMGGLSGNDIDYRARGTAFIKHIYQESRKRSMNIDIIGVGGIKDAETAIERIRAGANAVQVLTAIRGEGPGVAGIINREIAVYMRKNRIKRIEDMVGLDA